MYLRLSVLMSACTPVLDFVDMPVLQARSCPGSLMGAFSTLQSHFILDISAHVACQFNFMANIILALVAAFLGVFWKLHLLFQHCSPPITGFRPLLFRHRASSIIGFRPLLFRNEGDVVNGLLGSNCRSLHPRHLRAISGLQSAKKW